MTAGPNRRHALRDIAAAVAEQGFVTPAGREYSATAVKRMLGEGGSKSRALTHYDAKGRRLLRAEYGASYWRSGAKTTKIITKTPIKSGVLATIPVSLIEKVSTW